VTTTDDHRAAAGPVVSPKTAGDLVAVLHRAGLLPTRRRREVADRLQGRQHCVTAQELFSELRSTGSGVGLSTVYRTLHALAAAGEVHVFDRDGEAAYRRCSPTHHHHLVCSRCGLVVERTAEEVETWVASVGTVEDFAPEVHRAEIYGVCGACRRSPACPRRPARDHTQCDLPSTGPTSPPTRGTE